MRDFRQLQVWERSHLFALEIYKVTNHFPQSELYGLTNQMRRAAVSIGANIAEGCGRYTQNEFARFLHIASGSASELEYFLLLSHDLGFLEDNNFQQLAIQVTEIKRMLTGLLAKLS